MATPFLNSEEYDERAHRLYDAGAYDRAIETLKEGLVLYPNAVDLHVGMGYTRLAREEFAWAKISFERARALEPDHEDACAGLGETLLRFGRHVEALDLFDQVRRDRCIDDLDLLLSIGRALYREGLFEAARDVFAQAVRAHADSADAVAAHAYTVHRLGEDHTCARELRRALAFDPTHNEARVYLAHLHYDQGEWEAALEEFEYVPPAAHWDSLAVWRVLELKRMLEGAGPDDPRVALWEQRLDELERDVDPIDAVLAEVTRRVEGADPAGSMMVVHRVHTPDGQVFSGAWVDIVRQLRDAHGEPGETIAHFMRRHAEAYRERTGVGISSDDPEAFLRATAHAGLWRIEG